MLLEKFDFINKIATGILAHTPGRYWAYPGYGTGDEMTGTPPQNPEGLGGEYNLWNIFNLIPNFGQAFVNMTTDWLPTFTFLFYMVGSAVAIDFDDPYY